MKMNKIAFFSTSSRPIKALEELSKNFEISLVVTKTDKIIGKSKLPTPNEIKKFAVKNQIPLFEIEKFDSDKKEELLNLLNEIKPDLCLTFDFGFIVPKSLFDIPVRGFINTHFSLLPKHRGASAVQFAILNDDKEFGITYHLIDASLDTGDIIYQSRFVLDENLNSGQAYEFLFNKSSEEISNILNKYLNNQLNPLPQNHEEATYTYSKTNPKHTFIFKEDAVIDSGDSERRIFRKIKAYNPWPLLRVSIKELLELKQFNNLQPKSAADFYLKINDAKFINGNLEITDVTVENGKKLNIKDFISGYLK